MARVLIFSLLVVGNISGVCQQTITDLSVKDLAAKMDRDENIFILDVRTTEEINEGVIGKPIHIDYFSPDFEKQIARLDKNQSYVVYCASGYRSREAQKVMKQLGFKTVYNLPSGFVGWQRARMPVSKAL